MQAQHLLARHREHPERIIVAQVGFQRKREAREIVKRLQMRRLDARRVEFPAEVGNLGIGALERLLETIELQRREFGARHAFGGAIEHE